MVVEDCVLVHERAEWALCCRAHNARFSQPNVKKGLVARVNGSKHVKLAFGFDYLRAPDVVPWHAEPATHTTGRVYGTVSAPVD